MTPECVVPTYCGGCGSPRPIMPGDAHPIVTCVVCLCPLRNEPGMVFVQPIDPANLTRAELAKYLDDSARIQDAKK